MRTACAGLTVQAPLVAAAPAVARVLRVALYAAGDDLPAQRRLLRCLAHSLCQHPRALGRDEGPKRERETLGSEAQSLSQSTWSRTGEAASTSPDSIVSTGTSAAPLMGPAAPPYIKISPGCKGKGSTPRSRARPGRLCYLRDIRLKAQQLRPGARSAYLSLRT